MSSPRWPVDPFEVSIPAPTRKPGRPAAKPSERRRPSGSRRPATDPGREQRGPGQGPDGQSRRSSRSDLRTLARGSALGLVAGVGSSVFGFLLVVVISRGLHPARRAGVLFEAIALFLILSNTAELGADTGLVRMVARYRELGRTRDLRATIGLAMWPALAAGGVLGAAVFAFAPELSRLFIRHASRADGVAYIRLFAPFLPLATATIVALSGTRGFGTMVPYTAVQGLGVPGLRPVAMVGVLAAGLGTVAIGLAYTVPVALGFVASAATLVLLLRREERGRMASAPPRRPIRELASEFWRFSAPRGLAAIFQIAVFQLDILLVGALRSTREAGIYAAASRYIGVGTVALQGFSLAIAPQISRFLARHQRDRARGVFQAGTWWLMILSWPVYVTMLIYAPLLMRVFGHEFVAGKTALVILSLAMLVLVGTGNNKIVLLMGGGSGWNLLVTGSSLTMNVILNLILIPKFGMNGAAVAYATSIAYDNILTAILVWRLLRIHPFGLGYWVTVATATLCYGGVGLLVRYGLGMSVADFLLFGMVATALYFPLLWRARHVLNLRVVRQMFRSRGEPTEPVEAAP